MDAKEALAKIKEAEQKAELDVRQSQIQAGEILQAALKESERLLNAARDKAKTDGEKFRVQSETETQDEVLRLENETAAEIRKLREKAAQAVDQALGIVIAELEK
jgi:vacuolar-type H+-ATPase subunit H